MLLLKKKKYAALKVEHGVDGQITTVMEQKMSRYRAPRLVHSSPRRRVTSRWT